MTTQLRRGGILAAVVAATVLAGAAPASAAPGDGSAYGANVDVKLLGADAVQVGPFAKASTEGPETATFAGANVPNILNTGVINTEAKRDDESGAVNSMASVADVGLPLLEGVLGDVGIEAVEASCSATQEGITGSSTLAGANLGSLGDVSGNPAANTKLAVTLPLVGDIASITLNEQIENADGSLTVNAVHVKLLGDGLVGALGSGDLILSSATCGPAGLPVPMASGAGLWIGLGLLGAVAVPVGIRFARGRGAPATNAA